MNYSGEKERVLPTCDALTTDAEIQPGLSVGLSGELEGDSLKLSLIFSGAAVYTNGSMVGCAVVLLKNGTDDGMSDVSVGK